MPVYEYRCDACSKIQEVIQKFSDAPLVDCELCGGKGVLKKQMSLSSFALKGSGWYSTDYKKKPEGGSSSGGGSTPAAGGSKPSGSTPPAGSSAPSGGKKSE